MVWLIYRNILEEISKKINFFYVKRLKLCRYYSYTVTHTISISAVSYVTSDIHHVLQGLVKLTDYTVQVSAVLSDGGETDVSEVIFETGMTYYNLLWLTHISLLIIKLAPAPPNLRIYRARVQRDATVSVNVTMQGIPDRASYSINMSPPVGTMRDEHTTEELYLAASGLGLGRNYLFGIFATMQDGKRTDVRALTYKTRKYNSL